MEFNEELYHFGIKGMKWGVRRYQNSDGSLTTAGKNRYDRDVKENNSKKKDNRIIIDGPDSGRWVREDMQRRKKVVDSTNDSIKLISKTLDNKYKKQKVDLSNMTDKELRDRINRLNLERQYSDIAYEAPKGESYVRNILEYGGSALAITSSILGVALAIKELRG